MSLEYLERASADGDTAKLIRYVRLHPGDGNEAAGRAEIDEAWVTALELLLDSPPTDRRFVAETLAERDGGALCDDGPRDLVKAACVRSRRNRCPRSAHTWPRVSSRLPWTCHVRPSSQADGCASLRRRSCCRRST
jgi:hypothetical protein